jgi:hypothetical protein
MDNTFYTLQDYLLHTEGVSYLLMGVALLFITFYWLFIAERDDD